MEYSLFVDESGSFSGDRARWTVAGVLVPGGPERAESMVGEVLHPALEPHGFADPSEYHTTEIRKHQSAEHARRIVGDVLNALATLQGVRVGAVRNRRKKAVGGREGPIRTYERSYRLMLLDLIALLEASIPASDPITELHLVVATRTAKRERMTPLRSIEREVLGSIMDAVEVGLASRGLLEAASTRRLRHVRADQRWGLAAADAVANVAGNERQREDRALVARYADGLGFRIFDAFGDHAMRRARVAERDADLPVALARWALLRTSRADAAQERKRAVPRLVEAVLLDPDPYAPRAALEAVIERVRREASSPDDQARALAFIEEALAPHGEASPPHGRLLFRLRTVLRDVAHSQADGAAGRRLATAQSSARAGLLADPEGLPLVLDDDLRVINALNQRIELEAAEQRAEQYAALVDRYQSVWELFVDDESGAAASASFLASRTSLRARMTLARQQLFAAPLRGGRPEAAYEALCAIDVPAAPMDRSRLRNDRILAALRTDRPGEALEWAEAALRQEHPNAYDVLYAAKAAAERLVQDSSAYRARARDVLGRLRAVDMTGRHNPLHLAWRERAYLAFLLGDVAEAEAAITEAAQRTGELSGDAPVKRWLQLVVRVHRDAIRGVMHEPSRYADVREGEAGHARLAARADERARTVSPVSAVRYVSPW